MTEAKRKRLMYGILVVAVIWGAWNLSQPRRTSRPAETAPATQEVVIQEATAEAQPGVDVAAKRSEPWGRDPFTGKLARPSSPRESNSTGSSTGENGAKSGKGWSLTGIIDNGTMPFAFINGKMVKVGDLIDQARVVSIEKQKVTLSLNGSQFALKVNKG